MDPGLDIRPAAGFSESEPFRPVASQTVSAPDLPAAKAVGASAKAAATDVDRADGRRRDRDPSARDISMDTQSREAIYRILDQRSRRRARQKPDEALLRRRAYSQTTENVEAPVSPAHKADFEV